MDDALKLEEMAAFFEKRLDGYDAHMRSEIEGASQFYAFTAEQLPAGRAAEVLDLGCGTGLELEEYFRLNPDAAVTGIDLCQPMLDSLAAKFPGRRLNLVCASYFEAELPAAAYDAAVSVESLHHFPAEQKLSLYRKLCAALREDGYFILTDYFAESEALEKEYFANLETLKREQQLDDRHFYHYDTPLTVEHEMAVLAEAGFGDVRILRRWGSACTVYAGKHAVEIRPVTAEDRRFWFSLDRHLPEGEFDRKVRDRMGYVLTVDGEPTGLLRYHLFWDNTPFCTMLFVRGSDQRKGYGRRLVRHWEQEMKRLGYGLVMTSTRADEKAQHFYRKLGYRDCGSFFPDEGQPLELIMLRKL